MSDDYYATVQSAEGNLETWSPVPGEDQPMESTPSPEEAPAEDVAIEEVA